jgi:hypothetical protein
MSVGLHASDDDGKGVKTVVNTVSVGIQVGALGLSYKADDQAAQNWDAGATYTMGATVLSAGTDEMESAYVGIVNFSQWCDFDCTCQKLMVILRLIQPRTSCHCLTQRVR